MIDEGSRRMRVLVTGSSGYIGGRLVPLLIEKGMTVRCMTRDPRKLEGRWQDAEIVSADAEDLSSLLRAMKGVDIAYYLIHAMEGDEKHLLERERSNAMNFRDAAAKCGVERIVYLGGLGGEGVHHSQHLSSRQEAGRVLSEGSVPVTEFRAAIIVGSGSFSFEMLSALTDKLPVMVCPRWVNTPTQPIFINDVLQYLICCLDHPETSGRVIDIGGPDILTYRTMMQTYAEVRGRKRLFITVPVLTPRLSAWWVHLVTPVHASLAYPLIDGLRVKTVCQSDLAKRLIPEVELTPFREGVRLALSATEHNQVITNWSGAGLSRLSDAFENQIHTGIPVLSDRQTLTTTNSKSAIIDTFMRIGGNNGWYSHNALWIIRGLIDRMIGGVGIRRGRRDPRNLRIGDALDFWRVEDVDTERLLLRAEMKLPGKAWLEFQVKSRDERNELIQTAYFLPRGLPGFIYWYLLLPLHILIFRGMAREIIRRAELNMNHDS